MEWKARVVVEGPTCALVLRSRREFLEYLKASQKGSEMT